MKKCRWIALLLACSMLTACGGGSRMLVPPEVEPTEQVSEGTEPVVQDVKCEWPLEVSDETAVWDFSHRMLKENINETNPVLSPLSAYLAMGMVGLGAKGDTLAEFEQTMGPGMQMTAGNLMQDIPTWLDTSTLDVTYPPLLVANSVWVDDTMNPKETWLTDVSNIYDAEVYQGVLSSAATMRDINKWIEKKTNSLIKGFLSEPLDIETKLALFNTIYFKGEWVNEFEATSTYKEDFTTSDGTIKQVDMMHDYGRYEYYLKSDDMDGVVMDYRYGNMAMVALKPTTGQTVREMYESLSYEDVATLLESGEVKSVNLKLPKFEVEFDKKLNETIQNMGIKLAFDSELADFTGLGVTDNGLPLYISLVRQKAVVKLDEKGTEAAAVTMVAMNECASVMPVDEPIEVFFDEPFLYMIMDMESRTPLFMGIMDDPVPGQPNKVAELGQAEILIPKEPELPERMVMIDGTLYLDTGIVSHVLRCGVMDGEITSTVGEGEQPTENDQSNFGTGYGYQRGPKGTIQINMDDKWWIFAKEEVSWGITLSAKNVTSTGLTIVCEQAGGEPTGELQTGGYYILETLQDGIWNEVDCIAEVAWTSEAWIITPDSTVDWDVDWEWLYRELPPGVYRIGKNIMDFRDTGNYDSKMFYAEFAIIE